jgi:hypothetical protein
MRICVIVNILEEEKLYIDKDFTNLQELNILKKYIIKI